MTYTDEVLSAYLDGELDAERAAEIDRALEDDATLAAQLEALQRNDGLLRDAFAQTLAAKPFAMPAAEPAPSNVISFARPAPRRLGIPAWAAMAASIAFLLVGGFGGYFWRADTTNAPFNVASDGTVTASPQLAEAVSHARGGVPERAGEGTLTVALSFVSTGGDPCRQFTIVNPSGEVSAIACHRGDTWRVAGLVSRAANQTDFHTAGGPDQVLSTVADKLGFTEPMDATAEAHAIQSGWAARVR